MPIKKISELTELTSIINQNDNIKLVVNKYLQNGKYQVRLMPCSSFAEQVNSNVNAEKNITESEIEQQTKTIDTISSNISVLSTSINSNISDIDNISAQLSNTLLSADSCASVILSDFITTENNTISNIELIESSINLIENSQNIFDSFNETFKTIDFENINEVLALCDDIFVCLSTLSSDYTSLSTNIDNDITNISSGLLNSKINQLTANITHAELSVKAVSGVLSIDVVKILSCELSSDTSSYKLSYTIDNENLTIDSNRIYANVYKNISGKFILQLHKIESITNNRSENTVDITIKSNEQYIDGILVVTIFQKPNITQLDLT